MLFPPFYLLVYRHRTNFREAGSLKSLVESRNRTQDVLTMRQLCQPLEYNHDYVLWNTNRRLYLSVKAKQYWSHSVHQFCTELIPSHSKNFVRKDRNETSLNRKSLKFQRKVKSATISLNIWSVKLCSFSIQILEYFTQPKDTKAGSNLAIESYADGCLKLLT